jgi:Ran GTPase-activating protein (RanGAP) involved in mRNA processing and transport
MGPQVPMAVLNFSNMEIHDEVGLLISKTVAYSNSLSQIDISASKLSPPVFSAIAASLLRNQNLNRTHFVANRIPLGLDGAVELAALVAASESLCELSLDDCGLGREGVAWICQALIGHPCIQRISLSRNALQKEEQQASPLILDSILTQLLQHTPSLRSLALAGARPTHEINTRTLLNSLMESGSITQLDVSGNHALDEIAPLLATLLSTNSKLREVLVDLTGATVSSLNHLLTGCVPCNVCLFVSRNIEYRVSIPDIEFQDQGKPNARVAAARQRQGTQS